MDAWRTGEFLDFYRRVFEGILPVETRGCTGFWFAPWDDIVFWMGADNVLLGLADRPEFMHALIYRLSRAYLAGLRQFEALGLLSAMTATCGSGQAGTATRNAWVTKRQVPPMPERPAAGAPAGTDRTLGFGNTPDLRFRLPRHAP